MLKPLAVQQYCWNLRRVSDRKAPKRTALLVVCNNISFVLLFYFFLETGEIDPILIDRYNTPGFVGCLSRVQFNSVAPLKAALRSGQGASGSAKGILVPSNCGASPLTISPMASAADPWHFEAGRHTRETDDPE